MNKKLINIAIIPVLIMVFSTGLFAQETVSVYQNYDFLRALYYICCAAAVLALAGIFIQAFINNSDEAIPLDRESEILLDHEYDGIRELDNNLPKWWLYGFYFTIIFAVFYMFFYHFSDYGLSSTEAYEMEVKEANLALEKFRERQGNAIDETNVTYLLDDDALASGKDIFDKNCVACHLSHGGGSEVSVGPNLTDEYWIHGGGISDVFKTVTNGVPEKGMIAWNTQLNPVQIQQVSSYILSLQGTNPPGAKAPQGELYKDAAEVVEEIVEEAIDSTLNQDE